MLEITLYLFKGSKTEEEVSILNVCCQYLIIRSSHLSLSLSLFCFVLPRKCFYAQLAVAAVLVRYKSCIGTRCQIRSNCSNGVPKTRTKASVFQTLNRADG